MILWPCPRNSMLGKGLGLDLGSGNQQTCILSRRAGNNSPSSHSLGPEAELNRHALSHQASAAARDLEKPLGLTDGIMLAYKASKTAVTQSARCVRRSL